MSPFNGVMVKASVEAAILGERIASFIVSRSDLKLLERPLMVEQMDRRRGVVAEFAWSGDMLDGPRDIFGGIGGMFDELRGNRPDVSESINESLRDSFRVVSEDMIVYSKIYLRGKKGSRVSGNLQTLRVTIRGTSGHSYIPTKEYLVRL